MRRWKHSEQNFETFTTRGRFSKKTQNLLTKFQGLATSVRHKAHNFATITVRHKFTTKLILYGCLVSIFTVRINWKSFPWAVPRMGPGYRLSAFAPPLSIHFLIVCSLLPLPFSFVIHFTYFLLLSIRPFLPESSHSVSRREVVRGDRTWV